MLQSETTDGELSPFRHMEVYKENLLDVNWDFSLVNFVFSILITVFLPVIIVVPVQPCHMI